MTWLWSIVGAWMAASLIATPILARFFRPHPACRDDEDRPADVGGNASAMQADTGPAGARLDSTARPHSVRQAPERATSHTGQPCG